MSTNPPLGFLFSAGTAGIKPSGKPDLALALAPDGATAAAMFTRNQIVAAPVTVGRDHLRASSGMVRAVIVNSGNANCATGKPGLRAAIDVCRHTAKEIGAKPHHVFPSSTGIIGVPLPIEKIIAAVPALVAAAQPGAEAFDAFAQSLLTTDTHKKLASQTVSHRGIQVTLTGAAKGAGMIHPNMATMLVYLFTDLVAKPAELQKVLKIAVDESFHNISIDGDTSTNDTVLLLASGKSGVQYKDVRDEFAIVLTKACRALAAQIVADGEGVKHVIRLKIEEAASRDQARRIGQAIATSALVKTAWAGADPNWGRILAAIGNSGVKINPERTNIYLGEQQICRHGAACNFDRDRAHKYMSEPAYEIRVTLGAGEAGLDVISSDLTEEYVRFNAEYST